MQKNNSTVKSKNVSRNALKIIIQELALPDSQKVKLYEDLRCMGITDDNDPLIKFTMLQGIFAQYNGETAEKVVRERENIEESVEELEELRGSIYRIIQQLRKKDLAELKESIKLWKNEAIIGTQKVIVELRYEEERLKKQNKKEQEKIDKAQKELDNIKKKHDDTVNKGFTVNLVIMFIAIVISLIFTGLIYVNSYEKLLEEITIRKKLVKKYNLTPKLVKCNGKIYVLVRRNDMVKFKNGTTGAELDTWSRMDDIW